jgi:hypothetical protein
MEKTDVERRVEEALADMPRIPGVDWTMALTVTILRELEERFPGFQEAVRVRIERGAEDLEQSDDPEKREDAPSVRDLLASWVFNPPD